jgi:hypothetical protein
MSNPNNYGHLTDLVNSNTEKIRAAYNQQRDRCDELEKMVVAQNAKVATLTAQVAGLQKQVVLSSLDGRGSGATT